MDKPQSWSFSSLSVYETCPYKWELKYIKQIKEPEPAADNPAVRGNRIHEEIENFLLQDKPLPIEAEGLTDYYNLLKALTPTVEKEWGFTQNWESCAWNAPEIWLKMKLDAFYQPTDTHCVIVDHKSGKDYPIKRLQQGQLYAVGAMHRNPQLETFTSQFCYVDQGFVKENTFKKKPIIQIGENFTRRANTMLKALTYPPKPNNANCKYCAFGLSGNAACIYAVEK